MTDRYEAKARRLALRNGFAHSIVCMAGKHCEDPWCHHKGRCSCGADEQVTHIAAALRAAAAEAMEEAAKLAEYYYHVSRLHNLGSQAGAAEDITAALRKRAAEIRAGKDGANG